MPLLDHFHPPITPHHRWESFHSNWATRLADYINDRLPADFFAEENTHSGTSLQIDIATYEREGAQPAGNGAAVATAPAVWAPPAAVQTMPAVLPATFSVRVYTTAGGLKLVGAVELVSPSNKDRSEERRAFSTRCAGYLHQGISLIVADIVTIRRANLHNEMMRLMKADARFHLATDASLYAVAYRPVLRGETPEIDLWPVPLALGAALPTLPLRLIGDLFVPVDFEATYQEACRRRRLA
jgi:hypothetical protein